MLGWLLITVSLPRLPAALTSVTLTIQPVGSVLLGVILLGEEPSALQLAGVALHPRRAARRSRAAARVGSVRERCRPPLHELEAEIMEEVWARGECTVREVLEALNARSATPRAYTTVMTVMQRLDGKGVLAPRARGRADVYVAALTRGEYAQARAGARSARSSTSTATSRSRTSRATCPSSTPSGGSRSGGSPAVTDARALRRAELALAALGVTARLLRRAIAAVDAVRFHGLDCSTCTSRSGSSRGA